MSTTFATTASIRFGYGRRPGETPPDSIDDLIEQVERGTKETCSFPFDGISGRRNSFPALRKLSVASREARANGTMAMVGNRLVNPYFIALTNAFRRDQHLKVRQAVTSRNGFFERLAAFWSDHFAVDARKGEALRVVAALYEAEVLRPKLAGSFSDLLTAAILHPAMFTYLDQTRSVGPKSRFGIEKQRGLNENLARELIELHTMGAGSGYTQDDVRSAAYVLTGVGLKTDNFEVVYRPAWAEPGPHRVLGRSYGGKRRRMEDVYSLLSDLAAREETRRHICRKLVVHFIADDPPGDVIDAMVAAWVKSDGELIAVYRAMLEHPRSWEQEGQKARQPFDFVVAGLRALDVPLDALDARDARERGDASVFGARIEDGASMLAPDGRPGIRSNALTVGALDRLGQPVWSAPSPAGWEENVSAWITASQLTERIAWARRVIARFGGAFDPMEFLKETMADAAREDTIQTVSRAPNREVALAMVLASPEFNRR